MIKDLSLKYRPQIYNEFVGNTKIVAELIKRTIDQNFSKIVLFLGNTGTGKTTLERIYAKSLICEAINVVTGDPCNTCSYCRAVNREQNTEYISFYDGGSFGVNEVDQLIEKTEKHILGRRGLRQVFVIDELQSIKSKSAEEKLLKVLEKEHDNCYFIFGAMRWDGISKALKGRARNATYKLILKYEEILTRLRYIITQESMLVTPEFANIIVTIADNCNGSLRDAIGLLESVVYRKITTEQELFDEFELLSENKVDKIIIDMLTGNIQALEHGINEDLYKQISQKLSYLYCKKSGLTLNWWKNNQIKGIDINKIPLEVLINTVRGLNELLKYRYVTDVLIENCIIEIVNNNKNKKTLREPRKIK